MNREAELPPVMSVLLAEKIPEKVDDVSRWYRRIAPELRRQAEWTVANFNYGPSVSESADLLAVPSHGLDPFDTASLCMGLSCRVKTARQFARTIGLYAHHSILSDHLTRRFSQTTLTNHDDGESLLGEILTLHELRPMIEAGVISFRPGSIGYCREHAKQFAARADEAIDAVLTSEELKPKLIETDDGVSVLDLGEIYGYPMVDYFRPIIGTNQRTLRRRAEKRLREEIRSVVLRTSLNMQVASKHKATVLSSSAMSMRVASQLDERSTSPAGHAQWELARTVELPWIRELTVQQIVDLRDMAATALPRLRESFAAMRNETSVDETISMLRDEAAEVRAELSTLRPRHEAMFRNVAGTLGLTIAIYGFASDALATVPALGGLLTLLGLLHNSEHKETGDALRQQSKPGYVLVKAQELLDHASENDS
jgi:hypothetical protein